MHSYYVWRNNMLNFFQIVWNVDFVTSILTIPWLSPTLKKHTNKNDTKNSGQFIIIILISDVCNTVFLQWTKQTEEETNPLIMFWECWSHWGIIETCYPCINPHKDKYIQTKIVWGSVSCCSFCFMCSTSSVPRGLPTLIRHMKRL